MIDYTTEFGKYLNFVSGKGSEKQACCPFHEDKHASLSVNTQTGLWHCFACNEQGNWFQFLEKVDPMEHESKYKKDTKTPYIPEHEILDMHNMLLVAEKQLKFLEIKRGISRQTIKDYKIGYDGSRIWIPIKDDSGKYVNVRKYRPGSDEYKVVGYKSGYNKCRIFPISLPESDNVYIMEGEMDCLLARSLGLDAYTQTSGALTWIVDYNYMFSGKDVCIVYDNDDQGKKGAINVSITLKYVAKSVKIVNLPVKNDKEDFTDYIVKYKHTVDDFIQLCNSVKVDTKEEAKRDDALHNIDLFNASSSDYFEKLVKLYVFIIGKGPNPYFVPKNAKLKCNVVGSHNKKCKMCPLALSGGDIDVVIDNTDPDILFFIDVSTSRLTEHVKRKMNVYCEAPQLETGDAFNVEVITCINDVEYIVEKSDYTVVNLFYVGHGIKTNANYELTGRIYADPRTQTATVLVHDAKPAKSSIDAFSIDNGMAEKLKIFNVKEVQDGKDLSNT